VAAAPACGLLLAQLIAGEPAAEAAVPPELLRPDRPMPGHDPEPG
jgi:glycine/D-amino acid oxidase-like deaminating enzyme